MKTGTKDRAAAWVAEAIDAGLGPHLVIQSPASAFPDAVMLCIQVDGSRTMWPPDGLGQHIKKCLIEKGRVYATTSLGHIVPVGPKPEGTAAS